MHPRLAAARPATAGEGRISGTAVGCTPDPVRGGHPGERRLPLGSEPRPLRRLASCCSRSRRRGWATRYGSGTRRTPRRQRDRPHRVAAADPEGLAGISRPAPGACTSAPRLREAVRLCCGSHGRSGRFERMLFRSRLQFRRPEHPGRVSSPRGRGIEYVNDRAHRRLVTAFFRPNRPNTGNGSQPKSGRRNLRPDAATPRSTALPELGKIHGR
jgi:hypothetical protein